MSYDDFGTGAFQEPSGDFTAEAKKPDPFGSAEPPVNPFDSVKPEGVGPGDVLRPAKFDDFGTVANIKYRFQKTAANAENTSLTGVAPSMMDEGIASGRASRLSNDIASMGYVPGLDQQAVSPTAFSDKDRRDAMERLNNLRTDMVLYEKLPWSTSPIEIATAFAAMLWGGKFSPENYIAPGIGKLSMIAAQKGFSPIISHALAMSASFGGVQAITDPLVQGMQIKAGLANEYNYWQTAIAAGSGVGFGFLFGAAPGARALVRGWRQEKPPVSLEAAPKSGESATPQKADGDAPPPSADTTPTSPPSVDKSFSETAATQPPMTRDKVLERIDNLDVALATEANVEKRSAIQTELTSLEKQLTTLPREPEKTAAYRELKPDEMSYGDRMATHVGEANGVDIRVEYPGVGREHTAPYNLPVLEGSMPPSIGTKTDPIKSLRTLWQEFADDLGVIVRQGRLTARGASGEYSFDQSVIRMKKIDDINILAHEAGHFIHQAHWQEINAIIARHESELSNITGYASAQKNPELRRIEGYSEYFRLLNENPAEATKRAPGFDADFQKFLAGNPEVNAAVSKFQGGIKAFNEASPATQTASMVVSNFDPSTAIQRFVGDVKNDGLASAIITRYDMMAWSLMNRDQHLYRTTRELAKIIKDQTGKLVDLNAIDDPSKLAYLAMRSYETALSNIQHGVRIRPGDIVPASQSLSEILIEVGGKANSFSTWSEGPIKDFGTYLADRWATQLHRRWVANGMEGPSPTGLEGWKHAAAMGEYERANPKAQEWANKIYDWQQAMLDREYANHMHKRADYEKMRADREYVPLYRNMEDIKGDGGGGRGGAVDASSPINKERKGSDRQIINPLESIIDKAIRTERVIAGNAIPEALSRLAENAWSGIGKPPTNVARWVERVPAHEVRAMSVDVVEAMQKAAERELGLSPRDASSIAKSALDSVGIDGVTLGPVNIFRPQVSLARGENIVFYLSRGELQALRLPSGSTGRHIVESLTMGHPPATQELLVNQLARASNWLRAGVITSPSYMASNIMRDQMSAFTLLRGYTPFIDAARGGASVAKNDEFYQIASHAGMTSGGFALASLDRVIEHDLNAFVKRTGIPVVSGSSFNEVGRALTKASEFSETATRVGIFKKAFERDLKSGLPNDVAALNASFEASDFLPFGRGGAQTEVLQRLVPFMSGNLQGLNKAWRTLFAPAFRTAATEQEAEASHNAIVAWSKLAAQSAFHAAYRAAHLGDPEFEEFSDAVRNRNTLFKVGGTWIAVPKPFELAIPMNFAERLVERLAMQDSTAFQRWREGALDLVTPPYLYDAPAIKLPIEIAANFDLHFKRRIVPEQQAGIAAYLQAQQGTSKASIALAGAIKEVQSTLGVKNAQGVSPILIDHLAKGLMGTWGRDLVVASDAAYDAIRGDGSFDFLDKMAVSKTFFRDPARQSEAVDRFWKEIGKANGELTQVANNARFLQNNNRAAEARDIIQSAEPTQRVYATLQVAASAEAKGTGFSADTKALHPMIRAESAIREIGDVIRGLHGDALYASTDGEFIKLDRKERVNAIDALSRLRMIEARNALILSGIKGSEGREYMSAADQFAVLKAASPTVADELAQRYANKRVYKFDALVNLWPKVSEEIMKNGGDARLQQFARPLQRPGNFEFDGERNSLVRKPKVEFRGAAQ